MQNRFVSEGLVLGIILLFVGAGIYPAIAVEPIASTNIIRGIEFEQGKETEPKDYLFLSIIDIANNPDVNELLNQIEYEWKNDNCFIRWDFDSKDIFQKLLFRKPTTLISMLFTEPSITYEYFESSYNRGCEVIKVLGEENAIDIVESVEIKNPEILDELYNIIMNDEELYERITILNEMNEDLDFNSPFNNYSSICKILLILFFVYLIRCGLVSYISESYEDRIIISVIFDLLWFKHWIFAGVCMVIFQVIDDILGCNSLSP